MLLSKCSIINVLISTVFFSCSNYTFAGEDFVNEKRSPYYRAVEWGELQSLEYFYYDFKFGSYDLTENCKAAQIIGYYDALVDKYSQYIKSQYIGKSSDSQDMYAYHIGCKLSKDVPKIILICAQHGFEKSSTFGTLLMIKYTLECGDYFLRYLLNNTHLIIVPIANPYGFDKGWYKNANSVNLNRNWPVIGWKGMADDKNSSDYPGMNSLDQPETQAINELLLENEDAVLIIDFHTYGGGNVSDLGQINWINIPETSDEHFNKIINATYNHHKRVRDLFYEHYSLSRSVFANRPDVGMMTKCDYYRNIGCLNNYGAQKDIISITFEGFNGFPFEDVTFTEEVVQANANLLCNFLYSFIELYSE